jgi:hypothetical protein
MIDRNVLQEKIIDKMADAFLKALPAGEAGIWSSTFARADLRQAMAAASAILNHPPLPDFSRRSVFRFREAVWSL